MPVLLWVPEAFLARFPVAARVIYLESGTKRWVYHIKSREMACGASEHSRKLCVDPHKGLRLPPPAESHVHTSWCQSSTAPRQRHLGHDGEIIRHSRSLDLALNFVTSPNAMPFLVLSGNRSSVYIILYYRKSFDFLETKKSRSNLNQILVAFFERD